MARTYNHKRIEKKWQAVWKKENLGKANFPSKTKKFYGLIEFPYPSGEGLHVGHIRSNTAMDIVARKRRGEGYNVLFPIGWDAFGLPAENYAIKTGIHPAIQTKKNIANFRKQLQRLGFSFDWSREVNTTDPAYYKWTQWIFLQLLKKGLAYKARTVVNWCPKDLVGLANEEVIDGKCERCGTPTEKREREQWMLAITKYAERLDKDLDSVDYLEKIKIQQRNWIGKSEGALLTFPIANAGQDVLAKLEVFTTRPDTLFGATYVVLAPEHPILKVLAPAITNQRALEAYQKAALAKEDIERTAEGKEKTGVQLEGVVAINPGTKETVPIFIADYVLAHYGTGAIMAVPAHDERDYAFAKAHNLPIKEVVVPNRVDQNNPPREGKRVVERQNVHCIVRNPQTNKYLLLKWKAQPWITFPMGGVEAGEDVVTAAKREVAEETGYTNLKFIKVLGGQVRAEYFAAHKDQNRIAFTQAVMFDLLDETVVERTKEEGDAYDLQWFSKEEIVYPKVVHAELADWLARWEKEDSVYTESGVLINSGPFTGLTSEEAKVKIREATLGKKKISFKLRDWIFSRQRYWGEPIPIIHCETCGIVPVPEKNLPVVLPKVKSYKPTCTGESPLSLMEKWITTTCPKCKGPARRETDTMPQWAGSSWYFLRYADPQNKKEFASKKTLSYWTPVDWYNGGMEHTTLHLLYSRFWHKFLYDLKLVPTSEPYKKRTSHGLILAKGGAKMSKSKGNVINPDTIVETLGADTLRLFEMFMGPFDQPIAWDGDSMAGSRRFIERVFNIGQFYIGVPLKETCRDCRNHNTEAFLPLLHKTIKKVSEDIEGLKMNTAISQLMILLNEMEHNPTVTREQYQIFLRLLAPFAPHVTEELWQELGNKKSIHLEKWPVFNPKYLKTDTVTISVSINGKARGVITVGSEAPVEEALKAAKGEDSIAKWIAGEIKRTIYIPGKVLNIII
jgi:leucyl-tRNA synthetase